MAINAQDILDTLANSVTHSTLTPGAAANAGASAKGQEVNAYAKALKIVKQNTTFINNQSGTDTAAGDTIEEIFFSHQYQSASPYSKSGTGSYTGNVVAGNNTANGFNALFLANAIDQFRQVDSAGASPISAGTDINSTHYQLTQAQGSSNMTITLLDSEAATPTATSGVSFQFRTRGGGTAAAGLKLGTTEIGRATSATTLTLDSGATLGMTNDIEATLYLYAINNGGTIELGVINGQQLDESILHTSTALDGTADSASTLYSDTARTTLAVKLIGRMRITMNAVGTYDEDPTELAIIGVGSSGGSGELASGEKIYWQDTNQFIQGDTTSITIESDDTLTINSDTLASINSDTKNQLTAPTTNVISTTAVDANTPSFIVRSATGSKPVFTLSNDANDASGPVLRLTNNKSGDGADNDQAGLIEFRSKDDGTPTEFIVAQQFANVADASTGSKDGLWTLQVMSNQTLTNRLLANSTGVGVTGNLAVTGNITVSGTTTTINSTTTTLVDPIFALGTDTDGTAPGSDDNKDRGLLLHYYSGTAKTAFMGWDESAAEFALCTTATLSSEALDGTQVYGPIRTGNIKINDGATIGTATDTDSITIAAAGAVTFSQNPVFPTGGVNVTSLDIDGAAASVSTLADADLFIVDDGGGGTNKKVAASVLKTYASATFFGGSASTVALPIGQGSSTADTNTGLFSAAADRIAISAGGTQRLEANTTGVHVTSLTETSSRELKTNITPMNNSLDKIMALQGVNFDWKDGRGGKQIGLIADDVADVVPEVVQFNDASPTSLQYSKMVALLIEGMKEQQTEIDKLKKLVSKSK